MKAATKHHEIQALAFERDALVLKVDGKRHRVPLAKCSPRLANASELERSRFEISPSGYGIHWPLLDEDLSVDALLGISHRPAPTTKFPR
jgi:NAD(P)H-hydrate repair Nnr-like enzyme with NAD(P)H-hydrate epimerase domain